MKSPDATLAAGLAYGSDPIVLTGRRSPTAENHERRVFHLKSNRLLAEFSEEELASILDRFDEQNFARGELILEQDQPMEYVYLLRTGRVKIATATESGRTVIHYIIRPGDAFGVLNAFLGGGARYFVEALEAVAVSVIPLADFLALLSDHPKLANGVGRVLGTRLLESMSNVERLAFQDTRSRFISFLITAAAESGRRVRNGIEVHTGLRHRDLAELLGTTPQNFSRVLHALIREGLVQTIADGFRVRSLADLQGEQT